MATFMEYSNGIFCSRPLTKSVPRLGQFLQRSPCWIEEKQNMAIEIVDLPSYKMLDLSSSFFVSPFTLEGISRKMNPEKYPHDVLVIVGLQMIALLRSFLPAIPVVPVFKG